MNLRALARLDVLNTMLFIVTILVAVVVGWVNCQAANEASDRATESINQYRGVVDNVDVNSARTAENADRIGDNTDRISDGVDEIAANTSRTEDLSRRIDANSASTSANTAAIRISSSETAENTRRIADQIEAQRSAPTSLGACRAGLEVRANEYCSWIDGVRRFEVYEDGAYSPWDTTAGGELNRATIKVDFGPPRGETTFQARSIAPGAWEVLAAGDWINRGDCTDGLIVAPGELCVERRSQQPFLVYATDEHVEGDNRPLYPGGYAVLFWWKDGEVPHPDNGRLHDRTVVSGDHFEAVRRSGASWEIVRAN